MPQAEVGDADEVKEEIVIDHPVEEAVGKAVEGAMGRVQVKVDTLAEEE